MEWICGNGIAKIGGEKNLLQFVCGKAIVEIGGKICCNCDNAITENGRKKNSGCQNLGRNLKKKVFRP